MSFYSSQWGKRTRFEAFCKKLQILRVKRGQKAEGDSLLQLVKLSAENGNVETAAAEIDRYELIVPNLDSVDRAMIQGLRHELKALSKKPVLITAFWWLANVVFKMIVTDGLHRYIPLICRRQNRSEITILCTICPNLT